MKQRSGSKNSDQNFKKLRYNSRQENWRRDGSVANFFQNEKQGYFGRVDAASP
jgi:hypothetical protein